MPRAPRSSLSPLTLATVSGNPTARISVGASPADNAACALARTCIAAQTPGGQDTVPLGVLAG